MKRHCFNAFPAIFFKANPVLCKHNPFLLPPPGVVIVAGAVVVKQQWRMDT
jgi:hypothetical protein